MILGSLKGYEKCQHVKYLVLHLRQPDWMLHPMAEFIRYTNAVDREELLTWNILPEEDYEFELFYVVGDREQYLQAIEEVGTIQEYNVTPIDENSFYTWVQQKTRGVDQYWRKAYAELNLVVVPPIRLDDHADMEMTIVGRGEDLQRLVEQIPDQLDVEVREIGEFDRRHGTIAGSMTDRQFDAVEIAAELGYYDVPRSAALADVADALDCAESTASTLLRRAESTVMQQTVGR